MEDYFFNPIEENNNWPKIIRFMQDIVTKFVIGPSNTQVSRSFALDNKETKIMFCTANKLHRRNQKYSQKPPVVNENRIDGPFALISGTNFQCISWIDNHFILLIF